MLISPHNAHVHTCANVHILVNTCMYIHAQTHMPVHRHMCRHTPAHTPALTLPSFSTLPCPCSVSTHLSHEGLVPQPHLRSNDGRLKMVNHTIDVLPPCIPYTKLLQYSWRYLAFTNCLYSDACWSLCKPHSSLL